MGIFLERAEDGARERRLSWDCHSVVSPVVHVLPIIRCGVEGYCPVSGSRLLFNVLLVPVSSQSESGYPNQALFQNEAPNPLA